MTKRCRYCACTDAPHPLNGVVRPFARYDLCRRCRKQKKRRPCVLCGGPFYAVRLAPLFRLGCVAQCQPRDRAVGCSSLNG